MKRHVLYLLLILAVPLWLLSAAAAQEGGGSSTDSSSIENRESGKEAAPADTTPSGRKDGTVEPDRRDAAVNKTEKPADKKKKTVRKPAAGEGKEAPVTEVADDGMGENLLLVDPEKIKYDRIPGITIKAEEKGEDSLVSIPDDKIGEEKKKEKESAGIFGKNTRAIAGWGIVVLIFVLFVIYSKTRSRKSKRRVVRTLSKR